MKKLNRTFIMALVAVMAVALGCGKKKEEEKTPAKVPDKGADEARKPGEPARPTPPPVQLVEKQLPKTKLKIKVPATAKISPAIIAGADAIKFPGVRASMVVKKRLLTDKTLEKLVPWAKGHQIMKYQGDVLKEGKGKTYTYIYKAQLGGMTKAVFTKMFQIGGKDYVCFSNADNVAAAQTMKKSCDTITQ
jgi:hypothetical protein